MTRSLLLPLAPPVPPRDAEPLLLQAHGDAWQSKLLARRAREGSIVRLALGVYCELDTWLLARPWDRYLLAVVAAAESRRRDVVFTHTTALALHGLPVHRTPRFVHSRATSRGGSGRSRPLVPYLNPTTARRRAAELHSAGLLRSVRLPGMPGGHAHWNGPSPRTGDPAPVSVLEVTLSTGQVVGHVLVDTLEWACLTAFASLPLTEAVAAADHLLRHHTGSHEDVVGLVPEVELSGAARQRAQRTLAFADGRAESPPESRSRAMMHELGFATPELQHEVLDEHGDVYARADFWWERSTLRNRSLVGEFDGMAKYGADLAGPDGGAVALEREKRRELQLARWGHDVVRWVASDLDSPDEFARLLCENGVPRR